MWFNLKLNHKYAWGGDGGRPSQDCVCFTQEGGGFTDHIY